MKTTLTTCLIALLLTASAPAALLAYEGFDYDYTGGAQSLSGLGSTENGFNGAWRIAGNPGIATNGAIPGAYGSIDITNMIMSGGHAILEKTPGVYQSTAYRTFDTAGTFAPYLDAAGNIGASGTTMYVSMFAKQEINLANYRIHLLKDADDVSIVSGRTNGACAITRRTVGTDNVYTLLAFTRERAPWESYSYGGFVDFGGTPDTNIHLFVFKLEFGVNQWGDRVSVFMDPDPYSSEPAPDASNGSYSNSPTGFAHVDVSFDRIGITEVDTNLFVNFDEVRVGNTWEDVLPVTPITNLLSTYTWNNPSGGNWTDPANWIPSTGYPMSNQDMAVLPDFDNAGISIFIDRPLTVAVVQTSHTTNQSYTVNSLGLIQPLYFDNAFGHAKIETTTDALNEQSLSFAALDLHFLKDTDLVCGNNKADQSHQSVIFNGSFLFGNCILKKTGEGGVRITGGCDGSDFTGTNVIEEGRLNLNANNIFPDGTIFVDASSGSPKIDSWGNPGGSMGTVILSGSAQIMATGNQFCEWGNLVIDDFGNTVQNVDSNTIVSFTGTVSGNGQLRNFSWKGDPEAGTTEFVGQMSPDGLDGLLKFVVTEGNFNFGLSGDNLELIIDAEDSIYITNTPAACDLSLMDVTFTSGAGEGYTNWFFTCESGIDGEFNSITNDAPHYEIIDVIYDTANNRVGAVVLPEPVALGALALCLGGLALRCRR